MNIYRSKSLNKHGIYVIGRIDRLEGAKGGLRVFVSYTYRGERRHEDFISTRVRPGDTANRYFIKIDTQRLHNIDLDYSNIVPDSIKEAPYNGWESMPAHVTPQ